ncbi:protein-glutamine gamma-glutamyltransferase K isoform X1 [Lingula anatina]|uniref:Protein-glutamine gamma-glutamyltransferase K isoform X1 n=1 Tax=Lingula anatina TaxID=7574 RepID=A0A1S3IM28_LINAN|nr:protein-glutamine gamma-glutamyltransferase K isoform X1 [Lingula anatina]|eukprot:XP_013398584.1 protein-glutamine gamma-glutamyltransferase K isoform X1 [Lingula anatina]
MPRTRRRRAVPNADDGPPATRSRMTVGDSGVSLSEGRHKLVTDEKFMEMNKVLNNIDEENGLKFIEADFHIEDNRKDHHTLEYEHKDLIVRRGQPFTLMLKFDQHVYTSDLITLQFCIGDRPLQSKRTVVRVPVLFHSSETLSTAENWSAVINERSGQSVSVTVTPSAEAMVGKYQLFVETKRNDKENRQQAKSPIYVLFNAWCKDDAVYMADDDLKEEYVLNEKGRLWRGTVNNFGGSPWNFGQFEDVSLDAALYVLQKAKITGPALGNPVIVTRTFTAQTNSMDDRGILEGRWAQDFPQPSTKPWIWTGSADILEQFMEKKKTVKYGQCWVFSGVLCTLCRAVGIPCRSVTNFESAHDSDGSVTIDVHWNEAGEPVEELNDSIWNFHVWNEAWFKRTDLPSGNDGWQVIDATPQESSGGLMQCGPAPLSAIKAGNVYYNYDTPFVFAEVNGDRIHWEVKKDGSMECIYIEKYKVGRFISTKAVGSNEREDLTSAYKFKEGSDAERAAVRHAFKFGSRREQKVYKPEAEDVSFKITIPPVVATGKDFNVQLDLKNNGNSIRDVKATLTALTSFYTGVPSDRIKCQTFEITLDPDQEKSIDIDVLADDYMELLKPDALIQVYAKARVQQTGQAFVREDTVDLSPSMEVDVLKLQAPERVNRSEPFELRMKFTNPLKIPITKGMFRIEAAHIVRSKVIPIKKPVGPGAEIEVVTELTSARSGKKEIIVGFSSDKLDGISSSIEVYVPYSY